MDVILYLLPIALCLGLTGLAAFLWSLRNGQYDDMDGAAARVLTDDDIAAETRIPTPTRRNEAPKP